MFYDRNIEVPSNEKMAEINQYIQNFSDNFDWGDLQRVNTITHRPLGDEKFCFKLRQLLMRNPDRNAEVRQLYRVALYGIRGFLEDRVKAPLTRQDCQAILAGMTLSVGQNSEFMAALNTPTLVNVEVFEHGSCGTYQAEIHADRFKMWGSVSLMERKGGKVLVKEVVLKIPPVKMTKFLSKLGYPEQVVTAMANDYTSKPMRIGLYATNKYIPELYLHMKEKEKLTSCMSRTPSDYDLPPNLHPLLAYEGYPNHSDMVLLLFRLESSEGRPWIGRAIMRAENHCYTRYYGRPQIEPKFFSLFRGDMEGAKLQFIRCPEGYIICPHIDDSYGADYTEESLFISIHGENGSDNHGRLTGTYPEVECSCCGNTFTEIENHPEGEPVCQECIEKHYVWSEYYCDYLYTDYATYSELKEDWYRNDDVVYSDYHESYLPEDECTFSELLKDYILDTEDEEEIHRELFPEEYEEEGDMC